ncbi:MAG: EpsI family protein [Candidatus Omnitrophica bacterium]|nr:EpsI family protein [Candidatus Omnitrophota bacterium]
MKSKNFVIAAAVLLCVIAVTWLSYFSSGMGSSDRIKVADFPKAIGAWSSVDIPLSERDFQILETRNLILREYSNPTGSKIYLYIIYSEENRKVTHPPEVCYLGSGSTIANKTLVKVSDGMRANRLLIEKGNEQQLAVYWFKAGNLSTDQYLKQQVKIVIDRLLGKKTSGALIRVSTDVQQGREQEAEQAIMEFCSDIVPHVIQFVP